MTGLCGGWIGLMAAVWLEFIVRILELKTKDCDESDGIALDYCHVLSSTSLVIAFGFGAWSLGPFI